MAGSVQFVGKDQVMNAFESKNVDAWSIYQYKQLMHKGMGAGDLSAFLDMLKEGGSNATYTLRVYEEIKDALNIKDKTDFDGSFNFKLNGPGEGVSGTGYYNNGNTEILNRLKAIEEKFQQEELEVEEPETIGAVVDNAVVEIIKDPSKALQWMEVIRNIFAVGTAQPQPAQRTLQAATIGNSNTAAPATEDEKLERLGKAIDILEQKDPDIIQHLEKLAKIATEKPRQWKSLLLMLETF